MENYIQHHGIKGQKWGVRRFQNEDGSLTPEGQRRYKVEGHYSTLLGSYQTRITDKSGKTMSRRTRRYMEKAMKKEYKNESPSKYDEYQMAKRDSRKSYTYLGNDIVSGMATMAVNSVTQPIREAGKEKCDRMIAEYANKYLNELENNNN